MRKDTEILGQLRMGVRPSQMVRPDRQFDSVRASLLRLAGAGRLRRSDILLNSVSEEAIDVLSGVEGSLTEGDARALLTRHDLVEDQQDVALFIELWERNAYLGDLYEDLRVIEITLHRRIRETLEAQGGHGDWWDLLPQKIQVELEGRRDKWGRAGDDAWGYTDFIHLKTVLDDLWPSLAFEVGLRDEDRKTVLSELQRLNSVRNQVTHPVKPGLPTLAEFKLARRFRGRLEARGLLFDPWDY